MSDSALLEKLPLATGAGAGAGAYLLGYLITYLWTSGSMEERLSGYNFLAELFGGETVTVWQGVGWVFYNAHFVATRITSGFGGTRSVNFIAESDGNGMVLLYLVPIVLLVAAGLVVARLDGADEPADAAAAGVTVVVGYLPLAILGRFLFQYDGSVAPDIVTAVLLAGAVYPLVLGAIGGALWGMLETST